MRFPLLLAAYAIGIVIADNLPPIPETALLLLAVLLFPAFILRRHEHTAFALLGLISLLLGIILYDVNRYPRVDNHHLLNYADQGEVTIDGRIDAIYPRAPSGFSIDVNTARIIVEREKEYPVHGHLRLTIEKGEKLWRNGDDIRFRALLRTPRPFGTPGEFNLGRHLATRNIFVTAFVAESTNTLRLRSATAEDQGLIDRGREATAEFIATVTTPEFAPLVRALAIGDKSGLSRETNDLLARGGVSHLFAISGLNLTMIAVALYAVILTLYRRSAPLLICAPPTRVIPCLIAPVLILYLQWTGGEFSTQRALLMALAVSLLFLIRRRTAPLSILWFAAFAILLCAPLALFTPSFQLSFAALAGIIVGQKLWHPLVVKLPGLARYVAALFFSTLTATLATLPLIIFHFNLVAPAGLLTNIIAIPLISWIGVPPALAGSLLWPVWPAAARILFQGSELVIITMLKIIEQILALPLLAGWTIYPSWPLLLCLSLLTFAFFLHTCSPTSRLLLILAAFCSLTWTAAPLEALTVTVFSVGQGDSILLTASNQNYLIDGGGLYGDRLDTGRQLVAPALGRLGVHHLDTVILTHSHPDHAKGLASILKDIPCDRLIIGSPLAANDPLTRIVRDRQIPTLVAPNGWSSLVTENDLNIALFRPSLSAGADANDQSIVVYARHADQGVLLTGDLSRKGVQAFLATPPPGPVTLLKLPHHGSKHSNPELLLDLLHPRAAFVSVGAGNRFGFPHSSVTNALNERQIPLVRTDQDGSFRYIAKSGSWHLDRMKPGFLFDTTSLNLLQNVGLSHN